MNSTPRLRSAYPATPPDSRRSETRRTELPNARLRTGKLSSHGQEVGGSSPLIPLDFIDAPTQRLYVSAFYLALTAWRLYDYYRLVSVETESPWLFMKWVFIDGTFLYLLPELKIPWLQWSSTWITAIFLVHAVVDGVLMFRIQIPFEAWLLAFTRMVYDRELGISENRVKPASLLHNASLILGKQIVHILPEGSAVLNPEQHSFCIDSTRTSVELPIFVNQTRPKLMELLRVDQDAYTNETIYITYKDMKRLLRQADKELDKKSTIQSRTLKYQVKNTGIYRLTKVIDESNLEVQRGVSDTAVVSCPSASMRPLPKDKCRGELSNIQVVVDGTPPLKIKYSKRVNQGDRSDVSLTVQPEDFESAFLPEQAQTALVSFNSRNRNISWARNRRVMVPVNESLEISGTWEYSIYEVQDALSNVIRYPKLQEATRSKTAKPHASSIQSFIVHDKPTVMLECSAQHPLKVAKGKSKALPVWLNPSGQKAMAHLRHEIAYAYSAQAGEDSREDENLMKLEKIMLTQGDPGPRVEKPGFYTLTSVANEYCSGEVLEPSSCLLLNPPEPELSLISESIPHQCAGNSIGLRVNLDLIGTPPFHISYRVHQEGRGSRLEHEDVDSLRTQMEFKPKYPGHYTYEFLTLSDSVYQDRSLKHKGLTVEQDIKPTAWARFANNQPDIDACIREPVSLDVHLSGEAPWTLEFDIVQGGKRRKHKIPDITDNVFTLTTPSLEKGGQHALTLTSIVDRSGCKIFLEQEAKIHVRHQRPSAAFGLVDSQRKIYTLEGRKAYLPLRLSGDPPWSVTYTAMNKSKIMSKTLRNINDVLEVDSQDTYRLEEVQDSECPGSVDMDANRFEVLWVPRPSLQVVEANTVTASADSMYIKAPVCEGDQDAMELSFTGQAPFHMEYQIHGRLDHGSHLSKPLQTEDVALHSVSVKMETKQPGLYDYKFLKLGDQSYDIASSRNLPTIQQRVHSRPSARFADAGKVYNYCKEQTDAKDVVPITFTGNPPFALELGIKHYTSTVPEVVSIPNIQLRNYYFEIPRRALSLGTHSLHIRKVRDANGCEKTMEPQESSVRVNVVDMPSISSLEPQRDYCVGDRISFALSGTPPFNVFYQFEGTDRKASSSSTTFRRIAERPGNFTITAISDRASTDSCRSRTVLTKMVHSLPSVRISKGKISEVDIHEGGEAELLFEFGGTPPFEFTYTRSTNAGKGKKSMVLETKSDVSEEYTKTVRVSEEGTYEVVSIKDQYCGVTAQASPGKRGQQLLSFK